MLKKALTHCKKFIKQEEGASGIEYAVIAAMVAVVIAGLSGGIATKITTMFTTISGALGS